MFKYLCTLQVINCNKLQGEFIASLHSNCRNVSGRKKKTKLHTKKIQLCLKEHFWRTNTGLWESLSFFRSRREKSSEKCFMKIPKFQNFKNVPKNVDFCLLTSLCVSDYWRKRAIVLLSFSDVTFCFLLLTEMMLDD